MENKLEQFIIFTFYNLKRHGDEPSVEALYKEVKNSLEKVKDVSVPNLSEFKKMFEELKNRGFI
jgi:CRISPR/Cas system CSM-associated protein Csm2 small subunit